MRNSWFLWKRNWFFVVSNEVSRHIRFEGKRKQVGGQLHRCRGNFLAVLGPARTLSSHLRGSLGHSTQTKICIIYGTRQGASIY